MPEKGVYYQKQSRTHRALGFGARGERLIKEWEPTLMLHYALIFLVIALIAAFFGFGGIAGTAAWIAQILFVVFLILAVISFVMRRGA